MRFLIPVALALSLLGTTAMASRQRVAAGATATFAGDTAGVLAAATTAGFVLAEATATLALAILALLAEVRARGRSR